MLDLLFESARVSVAIAPVGGSSIVTPAGPADAVLLELPVVAARAPGPAGLADNDGPGRVLDPTLGYLHAGPFGPGRTLPLLPGSECYVVSRAAIGAVGEVPLAASLTASRVLPVPAVPYLAHASLVDSLRRNGSENTQATEPAVVALAVHLLRSALASPVAPPFTRRQRDLASSARLLAAAVRHQPVRITAIAAQLGCSVFHLCHTFRHVEVTTIGTYHQQIRLRAAARRLLEAPAPSLADLALEFGFSSHSHFTAAFRKLFGKTPSALSAARRAAS